MLVQTISQLLILTFLNRIKSILLSQLLSSIWLLQNCQVNLNSRFGVSASDVRDRLCVVHPK